MAKAETSRLRAPGIATSSRRGIAAVALVIAVALGHAGTAAGATHKEGGSKDATDSIKLGPIEVPIIAGDRVVGQAGVLLQLQLANTGDVLVVDQARGRLLDAFFRELYVLFDQLQGTSPEVSQDIIKEHLSRVADRVLGSGKIRDIVILGSYQRRNPP
jgi:hypothetical protein